MKYLRFLLLIPVAFLLTGSVTTQMLQVLARKNASAFTYYSTVFDGTNDYLTRGADLSNNEDAHGFTFSCWVKMGAGSDGADRNLYYSNGGFLYIRRTATNKIFAIGYNASLGQVFSYTSTGTLTVADGWTHILISFDSTAGGTFYKDDVADSTTITSIQAETIDFTRSDHGVGANDVGANLFDGMMSEFYFHNSYLALGTESNRRKFISATGDPVDLGSDGSTPTGTTPLIYLPNEYSTFQTNAGNGGGFTENGTLADGGADIPGSIMKTNLVAWYDFDDATDSHDAGPYDLTGQNTPTYSAGIGICGSTARWYNTAIDDAIFLSDQDTTVVMRCKLVSGWSADDYIWRMRTAGQLDLRWKTSDSVMAQQFNVEKQSAGSSFAEGSFYIVAWTFTASTDTTELWLDGVSIGTTAGTYANTGADTMSVNDARDPFEIDYLGIWDGRKLTDAEIALFGVGTEYADLSGAPTPDLLWWKMNEGSGTSLTGDAATSDDGTHDADYSASTKSGSGYALDFNGSSDNATSDNTIAYGDNVITVAFWMYPDVTNSDDVIFSTIADPYGGGGDWAACYFESAGGKFEAKLRGTTGSGTLIENCAAPSTGAWVHVLVVFDASTASGEITVYFDGVSQSLTNVEDTKGGTNDIATDYFYLGERTAGYYYDGKLDDVRIYSGDQSSDVTAIMNEEL